MRVLVWWKWILGAFVGLAILGGVASEEDEDAVRAAAPPVAVATAPATAAAPTETVSLKVRNLRTVHTDTVMVKGKVTDGADVYVNDEPAEVSGRRWWLRVELDEGENDLDIEAEKTGLRANSTVATVTYRETATRSAAADARPATATPRRDAATPSSSGGDASNAGQAGSVGQRNALASAKSYLGTMAFSKSDLVEQLVSEEFSESDARWAVARVGADWNEQAVASARSYLSTMPFSKADLIGQLESEGFTPAQAAYGVEIAYR